LARSVMLTIDAGSRDLLIMVVMKRLSVASDARVRSMWFRSAWLKVCSTPLDEAVHATYLGLS
jgi:hypothetical protein